MGKHTPGPWISGFVENGWGLASRHLRNRCLVFVQKGDGGILPSEQDARLMAAAPDLLESALLAEDIMRGLIDGVRQADPQMALTLQLSLNAIMSRLSASIEKAQGKK